MPSPPVSDLGRWVLVPHDMWRALEQHMLDSDYCFFCDNHPSHGHDPRCPLFEEPIPE